MLSREIRKSFLDFFAGYGHTVVPSSSLVPDKDPTLLFTNAGMVQFKNVFTGAEKRQYSRATSCQKCVRAGGKHNDLDNVGKTLRHHTFFEMLGNFSFGDYFKKDAIAFAHEFLLKTLGLEKDRLWVTVFREDDEALELWKAIGVSADRIVKLGEKDNFWSMGDEGPCGPCSEIIYDLGEGVGCRQPTCTVGCDCDRYLEIWNLVFMQYERSRTGDMNPLPNPSIDTGMGLERVASVMQHKIGNYDSDLFVPIIRRVEDMSGHVYGESADTDMAMRVISDHIRGATFTINDGVLPSKEGRGYVLRRIMRRAVRYGKKLGIEREFLHDLSRIVVDMMEEAYPELRNNYPYIVRILKGEEERFLETLSIGMRLYEEVKGGLTANGGKVIPGDTVYRLYDTYGFPVDITEDMAREDGLTIDTAGFERALDAQKERSRSDWKAKKEGWGTAASEALSADARNLFTGYEVLEGEARVLFAVEKGAIVDRLEAGQEGDLFFDVTPFYGEAGGQVADEGLVLREGSRAVVTGVTRLKEDLFAHHVVVEAGAFGRADITRLVVDEEKRRSVARNHTATHLLQYALRTVLGDHVKQSGSLVDKDRFRFDFTHFQPVDPAELARVEDIVNEKILECIPVRTDVKTRDDAIREGATALFEEKYGEQVRVVQVADFSAELCGGTHVRNTGEIGSFAILSEGSLASGVRRIEAVTGKAAVAYRRRLEERVKSIARELKSDPDSVADRVAALIGELDERAREIDRLKAALALSKVDDAIQSAAEKDGAKIVSMYLPDGTADDLRKVSDVIRSKVRTCVVVVGTKDADKGTIIVAVSKDLAGGTFKAGDIMKAIAQKFGGKGGGNPQMAQGGVPAERLKEALEYVREIVR